MKRFRLDITGKLEDRPRLLRAYGKVPGGEVALVLRPTAYGGVLVHVTKEGATQWSAGAENIPADWPRVRVAVERGETTVLDGPLAGRVLNAPVLARGSGSVALGPDGQVEDVDGDAPRIPSDVIDARTAVAAVKHAQKDVPKAGASTLRGQWSGTLTWDAGPYVELRRKLATYGTLVVNSGADGWRWRFEREERWFTSAGQEADGPFATLVQAIDAGMLGALGLVQPACGVRDTRRRGAYDATWAERHPLPEPKPSTDPTERLRDRPSAETQQSEWNIRHPSADAVVDAANVPSVANVPRTSRSSKVRTPSSSAKRPTSAASVDPQNDSACVCSIGSEVTAEAPRHASSEGPARRARPGTPRSTAAAEASARGAHSNSGAGSKSGPGSKSGTRSARASSNGASASSAPSSTGERIPSARSSTRGGGSSNDAASRGGGSSKGAATGNAGASQRPSTTRDGGRDDRAPSARGTRPASTGSGARSSKSVTTPSPELPATAGTPDEASLIQAFSAAVAAALTD